MENFKRFYKARFDNSIPPLSKDDKIYSDDNDKASILNAFRDQTLLDDSQTTLPQTKPLLAHNLDSVITTPQESESTLKSLSLGKASGPDLIITEFSKNLHSLSLFLSVICLTFH